MVVLLLEGQGLLPLPQSLVLVNTEVRWQPEVAVHVCKPSGPSNDVALEIV